jgi:hypothetical protein
LGVKVEWLNYVGFIALFLSIALQVRGRRMQREGKPVPKAISYTILFCTAVVMVNLVYNFFLK